MKFNPGVSVGTGNPLPVKVIAGAGAYQPGNSVSEDNPLPVKDAGNVGTFQPGLAPSEANPIPVQSISDTQFHPGGSVGGDNPLPVKLISGAGAYQAGTAPSDANPVPIAVAASASTITVDPRVIRNGNMLTFTARRVGNIANAETRTFNVAASANFAPAGSANDFGGSFPTATASFAAGANTATFNVVSPLDQPE